MFLGLDILDRPVAVLRPSHVFVGPSVLPIRDERLKVLVSEDQREECSKFHKLKCDLAHGNDSAKMLLEK
jgi:hypothetical protein